MHQTAAAMMYQKRDLNGVPHYPYTFTQPTPTTASTIWASDGTTNDDHTHRTNPAQSESTGGPSELDPSLSSSPLAAVQPLSTPSWEVQSPAPSLTQSTSNFTPGPTSMPSYASQHYDQWPQHRVVMAAAIPFLVLVMGVVLACILRRRRRKRVHHEVMAEFKYQARRDASQAAPPYTPSPQTPQAPPPAAAPAPAVVISPMAPAMGAAYFTGIDTSDAVSIVSNNLASSGFPFDPEHGDEPPPPYRPRSVAAISREASLRQPEHARISRGQLTPPPEERRTRSPFDDPDEQDEEDEDDAISIVSAADARDDLHTMQGHDDRLSEVSDLSYQDEATARHAV